MILLELRYSKQVHGGSAEILTSQNIQKWKKPGLTAHSRFISLWYHRYFDRLHRGIVNARDNGKRTTNFKLQPHCPFIVHSLFTVHSFVVHCPFIHCSLSIHCSFTVHSLFTFHFHWETRCTVGIPSFTYTTHWLTVKYNDSTIGISYHGNKPHTSSDNALLSEWVSEWVSEWRVSHYSLGALTHAPTLRVHSSAVRR